MRPVGLLVSLIFIGLPATDAQERKFPYEAVIDVEHDDVRCGPGPKYYVTQQLKRGDRVTVHRHDPGGWAMIAPPAGSFSWIQAEYVQKLASGKASLTANNVIVHVGSTLNDMRSVYQRTLSKGDTVEVIGEQAFVTERGEVTMYKIKPPAREYRWIQSKSLIPAKGGLPAGGPKPLSPLQPSPSIQGPIATEKESDIAAEFPMLDETPVAENPFGLEPASSPLPLDAPAIASTNGVPMPEVPLDSLEGLRLRLAQLDQEFRTTLLSEPQTWNLDPLRTAYKELDQAANHPAFTNHVKQRLGTLERYAKLQQDYADFYRLTSETQARDAQLLSMQRQNATPAEPTPLNNPTQRPVAQPLAPTPISTAPNAIPMPLPANDAANLTPPGALPTGPAPAAQRPSKFSGAGIVKASSISAPGVPPYMLTTPDGRLLAYLEIAPGVDIGPATNQAMGIIGERNFREELKADVIVVRGYQPVVLRTVLK
ncbi:hypothetical protein GC163_23385 [bacterium]|nr:hypothetical protein [bacterium]